MGKPSHGNISLLALARDGGHVEDSAQFLLPFEVVGFGPGSTLLPFSSFRSSFLLPLEINYVFNRIYLYLNKERKKSNPSFGKLLWSQKSLLSPLRCMGCAWEFGRFFITVIFEDKSLG